MTAIVHKGEHHISSHAASYIAILAHWTNPRDWWKIPPPPKGEGKPPKRGEPPAPVVLGTIPVGEPPPPCLHPLFSGDPRPQFWGEKTPPSLTPPQRPKNLPCLGTPPLSPTVACLNPLKQTQGTKRNFSAELRPPSPPTNLSCHCHFGQPRKCIKWSVS